MMFYGDKIIVDPVTGEPCLKILGEQVPWSRAEEMLKLEPTGGRRAFGVHSVEGPRMNYLEEGFVEHDSEKFEELKAHKILPPEQRPETHILEVVTNCPGSIRDKTAHAWIRLIQPSGEVYSIGFGLANSEDVEVLNIGATKKGALENPETAEWMQYGDIQEFPIPITPEQFAMIRDHIEHSQREKRGLIFNFSKINCTTWVRDILKLIGIEVDTSMPLHFLFLSSSIARPMMRVRRAIPKRLKWVCWPVSKLCAFTRNCLFVLPLGGCKGYYDEGNDRVSRLVPSFGTLFDEKLTHVHHPDRLRDELIAQGIGQ